MIIIHYVTHDLYKVHKFVYSPAKEGCIWEHCTVFVRTSLITVRMKV